MNNVKNSLSQNELEEIAETMLRDFYKNDYPHFGAVDIDRFVTEFCGYTLKYEKLSDNGRILGVTSYKNTMLKLRRNHETEIIPLPKDTILIEETLKDSKFCTGRLSFTTSHECAHQILFGIHPDHAELSYRNGFDPHTPYTPAFLEHILNWSEYQANSLAAALLMPFALVDLVLFRFNGNQKIILYGENVAYKDKQAFNNMASFLRVSRQAFLIRLKELKMVEVRSGEDCTNLDIIKLD
ncbi:MAG: hypothetical protein ABF449_09545 [Ethanoligenens sp.]